MSPNLYIHTHIQMYIYIHIHTGIGEVLSYRRIMPANKSGKNDEIYKTTILQKSW